jgi:hypothetical protein
VVEYSAEPCISILAAHQHIVNLPDLELDKLIDREQASTVAELHSDWFGQFLFSVHEALDRFVQNFPGGNSVIPFLILCSKGKAHPPATSLLIALHLTAALTQCGRHLGGNSGTRKVAGQLYLKEKLDAFGQLEKNSGGMVKMDLSFSRAPDALMWYRTFYAHLFEPLSEKDLSR